MWVAGSHCDGSTSGSARPSDTAATAGTVPGVPNGGFPLKSNFSVRGLSGWAPLAVATFTPGSLLVRKSGSCGGGWLLAVTVSGEVDCSALTVTLKADVSRLRSVEGVDVVAGDDLVDDGPGVLSPLPQPLVAAAITPAIVDKATKWVLRQACS